MTALRRALQSKRLIPKAQGLSLPVRRCCLLFLVLFSCYEPSTTVNSPLAQAFSNRKPLGEVKVEPKSAPASVPSAPLLPPPPLSGLHTSWSWRSPYPQGNSLYGIHSDSQGRAYAVGRVGTILKANPSWRVQDSPSQEWLFDIFGNDNVLVSVGANGTILRSQDQGASWQKVQTSTKDWLFSGLSLPDGTLLIVGGSGTILVSSDQGQRWKRISSGVSRMLYAVHQTQDGTLYAAGEKGTILRSNNRGDSWTQLSSFVESEFFTFASTTTHVFVAGDKGAFYSSKDQGKTWSKQLLIPGKRINALFGQGDAIFAAGDDGLLARSLNNGTNWELLVSGTQTHLTAVCSLGADVFVAVGGYGIVVRSEDGGKTFSPVFLGPRETLYSAWGGATVRKNTTVWEYALSAGSGIVYQIRPLPLGGYEELRREVTWPALRAIVGLPSGELLVVSQKGGIFRSNDGGEKWVIRTTTKPLSALTGDAKLLTAVGESGEIWASTDSGLSWSQQESNTTTTLQSVWQNGAVRFAVGDNGTLLRSYDQRTWQSVPTGVTSRLNSIWGRDEKTLYISGDNGLLLRSTNEGQTWEKLKSPTNQHLYALWGPSSDDVYAVGSKGSILHTQDGGQTWIKEASPSERHLYFIFGAPSGELYSGGEAGTLLVSTWLR